MSDAASILIKIKIACTKKLNKIKLIIKTKQAPSQKN